MTCRHRVTIPEIALAKYNYCERHKELFHTYALYIVVASGCIGLHRVASRILRRATSRRHVTYSTCGCTINLSSSPVSIPFSSSSGRPVSLIFEPRRVTNEHFSRSCHTFFADSCDQVRANSPRVCRAPRASIVERQLGMWSSR